MKKFTSVCSALVIAAASFGFVFAQTPSFDGSVLPWMFDNGLTKYDASADYRPNDSITRGESAKLFTQFAELIGLTKDSTKVCQFDDIAGYDHTLEPMIIEACEYGLLKGSNGKFMPTNSISEAEAITVVVRALEGFKDETGNPWWGNYYAAGVNAGVIATSQDPDVWSVNEPITRAKLGTWLYNAANAEDLGEPEEEILDILEEIFGEDLVDGL